MKSRSMNFEVLMVKNIIPSLNKTPDRQVAFLQRNIPVPYHQDDIFTSKNRTIANAAWESVKIDNGVVALSDEYTESRGLKRAQRYPWDETKGIYLLSGYHNYHCLVRALDHHVYPCIHSSNSFIACTPYGSYRGP